MELNITVYQSEEVLISKIIIILSTEITQNYRAYSQAQSHYATKLSTLVNLKFEIFFYLKMYQYIVC